MVRIDYQVSCNIWIEFAAGIPLQFEGFLITLPEFFPLLKPTCKIPPKHKFYYMFACKTSS